jgi:polysaccharide pyruvyl transferase WcaK-like protein
MGLSEGAERMNSRRSLLLLAGDTDGNIGDRAIVYATCCDFRRLNRELRISIQSGNVDRDGCYFGVDTIPRGLKGLPRLVRDARRCDVILIGGGGLFQDDDSMVKMPYWAMRIAALRAINRRKPIVGYSLGIGPLRKPMSRYFARLAFSCMNIISARDEAGRQIASCLSAKYVHLVPDPALLMPVAPDSHALKILQENNVPAGKVPIVGVAIRKWFHQNGSVVPHKYAVKYGLRGIPGKGENQKMIRLMASVLDRLSVAHKAFILFMPTYNVEHEADDRICCEIMTQMRSKWTGILRVEDPKNYIAVAKHLNVMLGARMHPTIFSAAAGTNIVGLSYNQKFAGFFDLMGLSDKVLPVEEFVREEKTDTLFDLISKQIEKSTDIGTRAKQLANRTRKFNEKVVLPLLTA